MLKEQIKSNELGQQQGAGWAAGATHQTQKQVSEEVPRRMTDSHRRSRYIHAPSNASLGVELALCLFLYIKFYWDRAALGSAGVACDGCQAASKRLCVDSLASKPNRVTLQPFTDFFIVKIKITPSSVVLFRVCLQMSSVALKKGQASL